MPAYIKNTFHRVSNTEALLDIVGNNKTVQIIIDEFMIKYLVAYIWTWNITTETASTLIDGVRTQLHRYIVHKWYRTKEMGNLILLDGPFDLRCQNIGFANMRSFEREKSLFLSNLAEEIRLEKIARESQVKNDVKIS